MSENSTEKVYDGEPDFPHSQTVNEDGDQDDLTGGVEDEQGDSA